MQGLKFSEKDLAHSGKWTTRRSIMCGPIMFLSSLVICTKVILLMLSSLE